MSEKIKDGPFIEYHENGKIKNEGTKINGKVDVLIPVCESGNFNKKEFLEHIRESYKNL